MRTGQKSAVRVIAEPLIAAVVLAFVVRSAIRVYSVPSASMAPSLLPGDVIVATPYRRDEPVRGDVIIFKAVDGQLAVKRVVAVRGDLIQARDGMVMIGGHAVSEPYLHRRASTAAIAPQLIPADHVFVMGDNRDDSLDSRHWGPVSRTRIVGRARMILWSSGSTELTPPAAHAVAQAPAPRAPSRIRTERIFQWIE